MQSCDNCAPSDNLAEFGAVWYLANVGRVLGSGGSLEQAGGDGQWVFLDQLPEAGGEMSGSWIWSLALFPRRQVELLGGPAGRTGGGVSPHGGADKGQTHVHSNSCSDPHIFTWPKGTWQQCWRCLPPGTKEGSWSLFAQCRHHRGPARHHLQPACRESSL